MSKITIIEGNSNDKDNVRAIMVKGEKGEQGDLNNGDIIDNLTSSATDKVLSAKQGKILKDLVDVNTENISNNAESIDNEIIVRQNADTTLQNNINSETTARANADTNLQNQISSLASGSPLVASSVAGMTDTTRVYVNTSDGKWYYYNGSAWTVGGVYQSTGIGDKSILEKMLSDEVMEDFNNSRIINDFSNYEIRLGSAFSHDQTNNCSCFPRLWFPKGTIVEFTGDTSIFKWAVVELGQNFSKDDTFTRDQGQLYDTGYLTNKVPYITQFDGYKALTLSYKNNTIMDQSILDNFSDYFKVKIPFIIEKNDLLFDEEIKYNNPLNISNFYTRMGNKPSPSDTKACTLIISKFLPIDTLIQFSQPENKTFKYKIIEALGMSRFSTNLEETNWLVEGVDYKVKHNNSYIFLSIASNDNTDLTVDDIDYLKTQFKILVNNITIKEEEEEEENSIPSIVNNSSIKSVNHRGYNTIAPENTLPAFKLSRKKGFVNVETDVAFTSDGVAVLLHDDTIDRTSNGTGTISNLTYEQVLQYDFGSWKSSDYAGTKIPTLDEFILLCRNIGLKPYIEIKMSVNTTEKIENIVNIVKKYSMENEVCYISQNFWALEKVILYQSNARVGLIVSNGISENTITLMNALKGNNLREVFIDASYSTLTDEMIDLAKSNSIPVEVWIANTEEVINSLNPYISGVTSDSLIASEVLFNSNIE